MANIDDRAGWEDEVLAECTKVAGKLHAEGFQWADIEDCLQVTVCKYWMYKSEGGFHTNLAGWLYRVTKNCMRRNHTERSREGGLNDADVPGDEGADPPSLLMRAELINGLWEAVEDLPDNERTALRLRYVDELTYEEIGACMSRTNKTARVYVYRAIRRLRRKMASYA